jgi:hypothetical protein
VAEVHSSIASGGREAFRRISTPSRGGLWCYARVVSTPAPAPAPAPAAAAAAAAAAYVSQGARGKSPHCSIVVAVVEQCASVSDMLYVANEAIHAAFGSGV